MTFRDVNLQSAQVWNDLDEIRVAGGTHVLSVALFEYHKKEPQIVELYCPTHSQQDGFKAECSSPTSPPLRATSSASLPPQAWAKGSLVYQVGSITKCAIALAILRLIKLTANDGPDYAVELDSFALPLYFNWLRKRKPDAAIQERTLDTNPNVENLLLHRNGFVAMNAAFFAPDEQFILPEEKFLEVAIDLTHGRPISERRGETEYSNANYIFLGKLIEVIWNQPLALALKELVFDHLGMGNTSLDPLHLDTLKKSLAVGHRVASDGTQKSTSADHLLTNSVQSASMGLRSSARDLTSFAQGIFTSLLGLSKVPDKEEVKLLLAGTAGDLFTPFGRSSELRDGPIQSESYATNLGWNPNIPKSGQKIIGPKFSFLAHHKAGYVDGFGSIIVIFPHQMTSLVVLSDSLASLDTSDMVVRYLIQQLLPLSKPQNMMVAASHAKQAISKALARIEASSSPQENKFPPATGIAGTYQHTICNQKIRISDTGTARFLFNEDVQSGEMHVVRIAKDVIRILTEIPLSLERWAAWQNLDFSYHKTPHGSYLMRGRDIYHRLEG